MHAVLIRRFGGPEMVFDLVYDLIGDDTQESARAFTFGDAKKGLRALEQGHGAGKLVQHLAAVVARMPDPIHRPGD